MATSGIAVLVVVITFAIAVVVEIVVLESSVATSSATLSATAVVVMRIVSMNYPPAYHPSAASPFVCNVLMTVLVHRAPAVMTKAFNVLHLAITTMPIALLAHAALLISATHPKPYLFRRRDMST